MSQKIITQFSLRLNKAKNQLNDVNNQCSGLKKQASKLKKQLEQSTKRKQQAIKTQQNLRQKFIASKLSNAEENKRYQQEQVLLNDLRKTKRKFMKEKQVAEREVDKVKNQYDQLVKDRMELEQIAKNYSSKLEQAKSQKLALQEQFRANEQLIQKAGDQLSQLKQQHKSMKKVIASTLQQELHTSLTPSPEKDALESGSRY